MKKIFLLVGVLFSLTSFSIGEANEVDAASVSKIEGISPRIKIAEVPSLRFLREKYVNGKWVHWTSQTLKMTTIRYQTSFTIQKYPYGEEVWYNENGVPTTRSYYVQYGYTTY